MMSLFTSENLSDSGMWKMKAKRNAAVALRANARYTKYTVVLVQYSRINGE
jgi:hypothetical protein